MTHDDECRTHDRRVAAVPALPDVIAEHQHRRTRGSVVVGSHQAAGERANAERREVVAGHVFGAEWPRGAVDTLAPYAQTCSAGLKRRNLLEFGCLRLE